MTTVEYNERLTRVGKGTPGGELLRRYWHPVLAAGALDENPVQSIRILGEDLVLYRDNSGDLGLIGKQCGHRLVDMVFGIPDEHGIRCPYHGWCYDESGQCTDTPLESPNSKLKSRVNIGGYPVQEMGGLIFAYLGEGTPPILPPWDVLVYKNALRQIGHAVIPCNWLQCQENASDPAHSVYLHGHFFKYILEREGLMEDRASDPTTHRSWTSINGVKGFDHVISKRDAHGVQKAMVYTPERGAERYQERWHSYMIFPNIARVGGAGLRYEMQFRVPIDDTHTSHFVLDIYCAPDGVEFNQPLPVPHYTLPIEDEEGNPILDYILSQDMVAWWSQGEITDRSKEHLGATDLAIIDFRNMLDEQIAVVENGGNPINFYRHEDEVGETIECTPRIMSDEYRGPSWGGSRAAMHRGFWRDDADRYGPIIQDAIDLMRRAEEHRAVQS